MTTSLHKMRASLDLPTEVPGIIIKAYVIVGRMDGNPWFPTPVPPLAEVRVGIDALKDAQTDAGFHTLGLASKRNAKLRKAKSLLEQLRVYVEGIANDNPESGAYIIESAGMSVVTVVTKGKVILAVYDGRVSGMVRLVARAAAKEATYNWQMSDDGGLTWKRLPNTRQAKTEVSGLEPGKTYSFRFRAVTRKMTTTWCDPVAFMVR